ncbi:hypothetical protein [Streptomyces sp. NPDC005407]|uniref:hypothetical protein n=1 Tax=Streptomyces sp. NPDC005407 TaxID=3155340 RepID=UPI0033B977CC
MSCLLFGRIAGAGWEVTQTLAAPEGADRLVVVRSGSAMIDPLWWVTVEQGHGLTAREWDVGHFNGDAGDYEAASARDGPYRLRMTTASGEDFLVDLDLDTAEPRAPVSVG